MHDVTKTTANACHRRILVAAFMVLMFFTLDIFVANHNSQTGGRFFQKSFPEISAGRKGKRLTKRILKAGQFAK
jgi:hypothetical protein